jgi:putative phosphoesterase
MKIAIVSDTHNKVERVRKIVAEIRRRDVQTVLHCGDIQNAPVVELFAGLDAHFVLGNCDWGVAELRQAIASVGGTLHDNFGRLELAGKKIAFIHGHDADLLRHLEASGAYDYLFHGHTHIRADRMAGPTRIINPGAMVRAAVRTFVVLDLAAGVADSVVIED